MMKKITGVAMVYFIMMFNVSVTVFASGVNTTEENSSSIFCTGPYLPASYYEDEPSLPSMARYEDAMISNRAALIRVNVQSPLEKSWRNAYSDYYYQANEVIETADNYLADKLDIDLYTISQPSWDVGSVALPSVAMNILKRDIGKGSADIMIAFAGSIFDSSTGAGFGMTSALNEPYCIVFDHGYKQNCKSAQHEIGHAYGLEHCSNTCVMKQGWDLDWNLFQHLCTTHENQWIGAKNRY